MCANLQISRTTSLNRHGAPKSDVTELQQGGQFDPNIHGYVTGHPKVLPPLLVIPGFKHKLHLPSLSSQVVSSSINVASDTEPTMLWLKQYHVLPCASGPM